MLQGLSVLILSLTVVTAQRFQEYRSPVSDRRRGSVDEDAGDYVYVEYDEENGLQEDTFDEIPLGYEQGITVIDDTQRRVVADSPPPNRQRQPAPYIPRYQRRPELLIGKKSCGAESKPRTVGHEKQCDVFYECYEGQGFLQKCPNGLVYAGEQQFGLIGSCDYPHNVDCRAREERNPPQSTEHCDWLYGIFGHETSCTRYWTCWNGTATEQFCIGGLLYNEETHACDWPQNVAGCQKHPLCKDDANGNVPLGKSCNRYWQCQGGYPRLQRCPAMLVFDKERRRCVTPPTEDCEVPTTKAPPPDSENFEDDGSYNENSGSRGGQAPKQRRGNGGGRRQQQAPRPQQEERQTFNNLPEGLELPAGAQPFNQN